MHSIARPLPKIARQLGHGLVDLLFPPRCAACDLFLDDAGPLCRLCRVSLTPVQAACRGCALPLEKSVARCRRCLVEPPAFAEAVAAFEYGAALAEAIQRLKWGGRPELGAQLGPLLWPALEGSARLQAAERLLPVPLHRRRLRERQFNQSLVLARGLLAARNQAHAARRTTAAPLRLLPDLLRRQRDTGTQTGLSAAERRRNVSGAFRVARPELIVGRRLLLLDDVMTTGATFDACARALLDAGAKEVVALTLARAVP